MVGTGFNIPINSDALIFSLIGGRGGGGGNRYSDVTSRVTQSKCEDKFPCCLRGHITYKYMYVLGRVLTRLRLRDNITY